jgi:hypothetical protein
MSIIMSFGVPQWCEAIIQGYANDPHATKALFGCSRIYINPHV